MPVHLDAEDGFALGRRYLAEERYALALEQFVVVGEESPDAGERHAALAFAAELCLLLDRPHEALAWVERLGAVPGAGEQAALLEAVARVRLGEAAAALALLDRVRDPSTPYSSYPLSSRLVLRAQALSLAGDPGAALGALVAALGKDPADPHLWAELPRLCAAHPDLDPAAAVAAFPRGRFGETVGRLVEGPPAGVDRLLEALWTASPGDARVLTLLPFVGHRLGVERAATWSARMRAAGRAQECPLLGLAAGSEHPAPERVRAAAVAAAAFGDERARPLLELAATAVADGDLVAALDEVAALTPDLVGDFLVAAAGDPGRALLLAGALRERGAGDAAAALERHAQGAAG